MSKGPSPTSILHRRPVVESLPPAPPEAEELCAGPFAASLAGEHGPVGTILYLVVHDGRYGVIGEGGFTPVRLTGIAEARMDACGQRGWAFSAVITRRGQGSADITISGSPPA